MYHNLYIIGLKPLLYLHSIIPDLTSCMKTPLTPAFMPVIRHVPSQGTLVHHPHIKG
jgi:hypothetical protein